MTIPEHIVAMAPAGIPDDIWLKAYEASYQGNWLVVERVADAILAAVQEEREQCAALCESFVDSDVSNVDYEGKAYNSAHKSDAAAIRNRSVTEGE